MANRISPGLTREEGRRFALTLSSAFAVLALVTLWSGRDTFSSAAAGLSAALVFAALVFPAHLGPLEKVWTRFGLLLSRITSPVFLGIVYFAVFTPVGWLRRIAGKNAIDRRPRDASYWVNREPADPEVRRRGMERQF